MKKILLLTASSAAILLSGCSRDYTPAAGASGEDIFKGACMECHEAIEGKENVFYELKNEQKNAEFIADKISSGSLIMPKFPNITGDSLKAVSQYAAEHSVTK
ncbi:MAG: cytochrome c [Gammaproteobacteria bacterium]|nr:cytochrome c [Gammaproteobacteria bacterium]